jgi:hypothetical protein
VNKTNEKMSTRIIKLLFPLFSKTNVGMSQQDVLCRYFSKLSSVCLENFSSEKYAECRKVRKKSNYVEPFFISEKLLSWIRMEAADES